MNTGFNSFGKTVPENRIEKTRFFIKDQLKIENSDLVESIILKFKQAIENDMPALVIGHSRELESLSPLKNLDETSRYMVLASLCTD